MNKVITYPLTVPALQVLQPLGVFYVISLPAKIVLQVAESERLRAVYSSETGTYHLEGTQRERQEKRLDSITDYINRSDAAFPNAIILAANSRSDFELDSDGQDDHGSEQLEWSVSKGANGGYELTIPSEAKTASIIDGQHRLFGFVNASPERLEMDLVCAVFIDLPLPFQAQLFAIINSTQKPVDKSLTYEQFGYNIDDETPEFWTPEKLAVFLTRKLSTEAGSPVQGKVLIAPKKDAHLLALSLDRSWRVSTAVIVEGVLRLISSNPKRDANFMLTGKKSSREKLVESRKDKSPLRDLYLQGNDALIYKVVNNYLTACDAVFWSVATDESFITRTIGVQALLDLLRLTVVGAMENKDISVGYFIKVLAPAGNIDFSDVKFKNASGSGRSIIARSIKDAIGLT
ncbi:DGQHR domain-containing protein [Pseudomonas viridiflava]|uniref:DGQHR domain-containing protein n=1 Tax=Pseudomonas viridiflava TaxID=33069 RepID=UPI00040E43D1|nr:DGQHR domain-containing protein [Pseudomonas viridiflava]